jgi:hypothetical protein
VRSGDLVWLLGDVIFSPTSGTEQSHSRSTVPTHTVPPPLIHENAEWPAGRGLKHSMHKRPMECANVDQGQPMEVETVEEPQEEARRPAWSHDDYMMHVRLANLEHTGLTCAVHSAFLEAGCRPTWKSEVSRTLAFPSLPFLSCFQGTLTHIAHTIITLESMAWLLRRKTGPNILRIRLPRRSCRSLLCRLEQHFVHDAYRLMHKRCAQSSKEYKQPATVLIKDILLAQMYGSQTLNMIVQFRCQTMRTTNSSFLRGPPASRGSDIS